MGNNIRYFSWFQVQQNSDVSEFWTTCRKLSKNSGSLLAKEIKSCWKSSLFYLRFSCAWKTSPTNLVVVDLEKWPKKRVVKFWLVLARLLIFSRYLFSMKNSVTPWFLYSFSPMSKISNFLSMTLKQCLIFVFGHFSWKSSPCCRWICWNFVKHWAITLGICPLFKR